VKVKSDKIESKGLKKISKKSKIILIVFGIIFVCIILTIRNQSLCEKGKWMTYGGAPGRINRVTFYAKSNSFGYSCDSEPVGSWDLIDNYVFLGPNMVLTYSFDNTYVIPTTVLYVSKKRLVMWIDGEIVTFYNGRDEFEKHAEIGWGF